MRCRTNVRRIQKFWRMWSALSESRHRRSCKLRYVFHLFECGERIWVGHAAGVLVSASRRNNLRGKSVKAGRFHQHAGRVRYPGDVAPRPVCLLRIPTSQIRAEKSRSRDANFRTPRLIATLSDEVRSACNSRLSLARPLHMAWPNTVVHSFNYVLKTHHCFYRLRPDRFRGLRSGQTTTHR
jgi:hypothetical protein